MKLGQKVKCGGYIKKTGNYILLSNNRENDCLQMFDNETKETKELEYEEDVTVKKIIICNDFEGLVVGKKRVYFNIYTTIENDVRGVEYERIHKGDPIYCLKVYYALGKSRIVPFHLIEVNKNE